KWREPVVVPVTRVDGKPLPPNVPPKAVLPLSLDCGKEAQDFELSDAHRLLLSDFGEAFAPEAEARLGKDCNTPLQMRAPETLFEPEAPISYPSDIWALGTAIWEILGMKAIFSEWTTEHEIVEQQLNILGSDHFPSTWREQWERPGTDEEDYDTQQFQIPRRPTAANRYVWPPLEQTFENCVQLWRRKQQERCGGAFDDEETRAILDLIRGMLRFRPEERLAIDEVLRSEWMVKWALPALEQ
ncbi:hypothetical protein E4U53_004572, partial [Claviceps sorghi]